jgi:RNA polymerase sigma factor
MRTNGIFTDKSPIQERVIRARYDKDEANALITDYLMYIKSEASKASGRIVTEQDDAFSIAMIGFHEAIYTYEETRGAFLKYASVIIRNKLIDEHRKEKKHAIQVSIDEVIVGDGEITVGDTIRDEKDEYAQMDSQDATSKEIMELTSQLKKFDITLTDIADNCPRQDRTLESCHKALAYAVDNPELIEMMKVTRKLPLASLVTGARVERKTLERHRKYLVALLLIYSNGYENIRGHLKRVVNARHGEARS